MDYYYIHCETCYNHYKRIPIISYIDHNKKDDFVVDGHCDECKKLGFHDNSIYYNNGDDDMGYYQFTRIQFENELTKICNDFDLSWRDITEASRKAGKKTEERIYETTTANSGIRTLIYSTIDLRTNLARDNGGDAVRINLWINTAHGKGHKKLKTHNRVDTLFVNMRKTFREIEAYVNDEPVIKKWVNGIKFGALKKEKAGL